MSTLTRTPTEARFGKYAVLRRIGAGGMAEVFKCRLSGIGGFDKVLVVKRILPDLADDPQFVNMFLDEARVAANLSHPNIIQIYEIDQIDGVPYIAMEYVRGPTFSQMIREGRKRAAPNYAVAARVMSGVAEALHYAHNASDAHGKPLALIHRDVSPQNILVSLEGVAKLLDFGVAKAAGQLQLTNAGTVKGKLKFMAPEQFHGKATKIDHRVDIFAAGVCLYQATTFRLPYNGETEVDVMKAAAAGEFPRPSEIVPDFPPELERIILWAMAPEVSSRCPDAQTLHEALEGYLKDTACTTWTVRHYIRQLFPDVENSAVLGTAYANEPLSSRNFSPPSLARGPSRSGSSEVPSEVDVEVLSSVGARPRWAMPLVGGLMVAGLFAIAGSILLRGPSAAPEAEAPKAATATPPEKEAPDLGPLLDQANKALDGRRNAAAKELLATARTEAKRAGLADARLIQLEKRLRAEETMAAAKVAVAHGRYAEAITLARQVLAEQADHPAAMALLLEATEQSQRAERAAAERPERVEEAPRRVVTRNGTLSVETDPRAQLFVDDRPVGLAPLRRHSLSEGSHRLRASAPGHTDVEQNVKVNGGREVSFRLKLPRETRREERPRVAEASPPPPAPAPEREREKEREPEPKEAAPEPAPTGPLADLPMPPPPSPAAPAQQSARTVTGGAAAGIEAAAYSGELECPESTHPAGVPPPRGTQVWCESSDGQKNGRYLRYFSSGKKAEEGEFRNGKKHGRWIEYYEQGGERERTEWRKGVKSW